jgi:hypothetical protein
VDDKRSDVAGDKLRSGCDVGELAEGSCSPVFPRTTVVGVPDMGSGLEGVMGGMFVFEKEAPALGRHLGKLAQ